MSRAVRPGVYQRMPRALRSARRCSFSLVARAAGVVEECAESYGRALDGLDVLSGYPQVPFTGVELACGRKVGLPPRILRHPRRRQHLTLTRGFDPQRLEQVLLRGGQLVPPGTLSGDPGSEVWSVTAATVS